MDNRVSVRQRLEELKSYVYDELNLLKMQIRKSNGSDAWNSVQNKYKRLRHMRSYSRTEKNSGRKYKRL